MPVPGRSLSCNKQLNNPSIDEHEQNMWPTDGVNPGSSLEEDVSVCSSMERDYTPNSSTELSPDVLSTRSQSPGSETHEDILDSPFLAPIKPIKTKRQKNNAGSPLSLSSGSYKSSNLSFVYENPELKERKDFLKNCTAQLTISVGFSDNHSGQFFRDTLRKAMQTFGKVYLMVDDSIQAKTKELQSTFNDTLLKEIAIQEGDEWLEENKIQEFQQEYGERLVVLRWKDFEEKRLKEITEEMRKLYDEFVWEEYSIAPLSDLESPTKEPDPNTIYIKHEKGKLFYHISLFSQKDDKGKIKQPRQIKILEIGSQKLPLNDPLFDEDCSLSWPELRNKYSQIICESVNPIKLGIDLTAEEFYHRKKSEIRVTREEAIKKIRAYLFEECGVMKSLWPQDANFELYSKRTSAMEAIHRYLIMARVKHEERHETHILESVSIRGKPKKHDLNNKDNIKIGMALLLTTLGISSENTINSHITTESTSNDAKNSITR